MKLSFTYGQGAFVLPTALLAALDKASKKDLRILLELAADPLSQLDLNAATTALAARLGIGKNDISAALAFWRGAGVIATEEGEVAAAPVAQEQQSAPAAPIVIAERSLPAYTTEELSGILDRREELRHLIDDCQQAFGKIFNQSEITVIAGLSEYLGLDGEYILLLLTHCRNMEKKSLRYVEKMAITLHDEGVQDPRELEQRLQHIELMAKASGKVRAMFGITSRSLTSKEKEFLEDWICAKKYDERVIKRAYEITVDSINKPLLSYANKILERWYAEGYRTLEDVEKALAEYKRKKQGNGSSFDVDEFFEAALKRTYGES